MKPNTAILRGDCLVLLEQLPANSVDALVTDPPAGISFMGKDWDGDRGGRENWIAWMTQVMVAVYRVLKPGAHGFVWAIPRTSHWTATALENAGFEVRDVVTHLFGSGFPKSLDVSKAIDRAAGAKRPRLGRKATYRKPQCPNGWNCSSRAEFETGPATRGAREWSGWGTALKPASEHWILVRKPLAEKTVASNVLKWGTGAINVDACRIPGTIQQVPQPRFNSPTGKTYGMKTGEGRICELSRAEGRFPANLVLDKAAAELLDAQSGITKSQGGSRGKAGNGWGMQAQSVKPGLGDTGGASRFFYVAKASKRDKGVGNTHPTVKSTKLMEYLIRLITPPGGTVLDPFAGSGTTAVATKRLRLRFIGIEREREYVRIAQRRLKAA